MSVEDRLVIEVVMWASFGLRMLAVLGVVVVALAMVRKTQPMASWMLAGAAAIEAFDAVLWRVFSLSTRHLSTSVDYVLVPLRLVSIALGLAVGVLIVLAVWRLAKNVPLTKPRATGRPIGQ